MYPFTKDEQSQEISKFSLEIIKAAIKAAKATSPEREKLILDLEYVIDTIENNISQSIVCNKTICRKYREIFVVAEKYNLRRISDEQAELMSQQEQIMVLHQIAHYLKDRLSSENKYIKGLTFAEEIAKSALGYVVKQGEE